ncbi:MAG: metal ABC transporter ATP-binding protein [Candidatus Micrarchaeia archaeon]
MKKDAGKPPILEFDGISFSYAGEPTIEAVSFAVKKGDFLGIIGPNGAGKSTLFKIALGLEKPTSGSVKLFGKKQPDFSDWHRIGFVPQKVQFDPNFPASVFEVAAMGLAQKPGILPLSSEQKWAVLDALNEVGLEKQADRRIGELSGGQMQRAFLARALVSKPDLLLLDEPTTGIDSEQQEKFCCLLERLHENGITIVIISHDLTFMSYLVNKVICINRRVFFCGHPKDIAKSGALPKAYGHGVHAITHDHEHGA